MKDKEIYVIKALGYVEDFIDFITFGFVRPTWSTKKAKARFTRLTIANVEKRRQDYITRIEEERRQAQAFAAMQTKEPEDDE